MITYVKTKNELPNYETLNQSEPQTDKIFNNCKILCRYKKEIIDTREMQKKYKWQCSIPQTIRDVNLNIKNDPKSVFRSRKNSCNNSMMSTQRYDYSPNQDRHQILKENDSRSLHQIQKPTINQGGYAIYSDCKNSPDNKREERYYFKQISVRNSAIKGTSNPPQKLTSTESDDQNNKSLAVKYIGVHNDMIGILSRKVPIQIEQEKVMLFHRNKDSRKCKTRQNSCPDEQSFQRHPYPLPSYLEFMSGNYFYPKQLDNRLPLTQQETGKKRIILKEYEVSEVTKQSPQQNQKQDRQPDQNLQEQRKQSVYSSLQCPVQIQVNNISGNTQSNNSNFLTSNNISSIDSTPMQKKFSSYQKKIQFHEPKRQKTDQDVPLNQNYIVSNIDVLKKCETDINYKSPRDKKYSYTDCKPSTNLSPQMSQKKLSVDGKATTILQKKQELNEQEIQEIDKTSQLIIGNKLIRTKRALSSQSKRVDTSQNEDLIKQINKIQNQKYSQYIQENLCVNKQFYQSFQNQKKYMNGSEQPSAQNISQKNKQLSQEYDELMPEQPEPQKYDNYVINRYSISKRLKPVVKQREKHLKYSKLQNIQVDWVNFEKKVTYY